MLVMSIFAASPPSVVSYSLVMPPVPDEPPMPGVTWMVTVPLEPAALADMARPMTVPMAGLLEGVALPAVFEVTKKSPMATAAVSTLTVDSPAVLTVMLPPAAVVPVVWLTP